MRLQYSQKQREQTVISSTKSYKSKMNIAQITVFFYSFEAHCSLLPHCFALSPVHLFIYLIIDNTMQKAATTRYFTILDVQRWEQIRRKEESERREKNVLTSHSHNSLFYKSVTFKCSFSYWFCDCHCASSHTHRIRTIDSETFGKQTKTSCRLAYNFERVLVFPHSEWKLKENGKKN